MIPALSDAGAPASTCGLSRRTVWFLALVAGAAVANNYYAQPLLNDLSDELGVPHAAAGLLVTVSQLGYLAGLALLVPLGDLMDRRKLIVTMLVVLALSATVASLATNFLVFAISLAALGVVSVVVQVVVPLTAVLSHPTERGRAVGIVIMGALTGVLLARTASGMVTEVTSWRVVYLGSAGLMLALAALVRRAVPKTPPPDQTGYGLLLRSVVTLVLREPVLRRRMVIGFCIYGSFSAMWTALTMLLGAAPFSYSEATIGLFGLAGVIGAAAAPVAGRWVDRGHDLRAGVGLLAVLITSWGVLAVGGHSLLALVLGIILLDLAVQATHTQNQSMLYSLRASDSSRVTTAYLCSVFLGMAAGSSIASVAYAAVGWAGVCTFGAVLASLALGVWVATPVAAQIRKIRSGRAAIG